MALALGGNSFYCLAIYFKKKLHVKSKVMIVNLAVINIVISLTTPLFECMHVYSYPRWPYGNILNNVHNSFLIFTVVAPFVYSTAISFDRYLAVTKPFRYQAFATKRKFTVVVSITWIYSILWIVILGCNFKKVPSNIYTWNVPKTLHDVFLGIHLIIPIVVIPFVYTQIILTVCAVLVQMLNEVCNKQRYYSSKKVCIGYISFIPSMGSYCDLRFNLQYISQKLHIQTTWIGWYMVIMCK